MTEKTQPTDAELKAMWQLHAADIGGIFYYARAVLAKWGTPVPASQPVAVPAPHYGKGRYLGFARHNDAYSVAQVQAMLAAVPRNATLYDPDEVAFPTQRCADGTDAPTELTSIAAAQKGGQHGTE